MLTSCTFLNKKMKGKLSFLREFLLQMILRASFFKMQSKM